MISKFGFITNYSTSKRKKYNDSTRKEVARLKQLGLSIRKIAIELNIPKGSIHCAHSIILA
jgi:IS30 family transposase